MARMTAVGQAQGTILRVLLWGTVLFGVCLRFYGLDWGTDIEGIFHPLHPDETAYLNAASQLREDLKPAITSYGTLTMYLLHLFGAPAAFLFEESLFEPESQEFTYVVARTLSALFSFLTIWFVFAIGKRTDDDRVGLLAAAFYAVMVLPIQLSHFYTPDGLFAALAALSLYQSVKAEQQGARRDFILTGIFVGLAASVRLGGILLLVPLAVVRLGRLLSRAQRNSSEVWSRRAWRIFILPGVALGVALALLSLLQPHMVLEPTDYLRPKGGGDLMTSVGIANGQIARTWTLYDGAQPRFFFQLTNLLYFAVGLPLQIVGLLGLVFLLKRPSVAHYQVLAWCVLWFLTIGVLQAKNIRYLAPLLPFLALGAARLCLLAYRASVNRLRVFTAVGIALLLLSSAVHAAAFTSIYGASHSRIDAGLDIARRFPTGSTIGVEHTGLSMEPHIPPGYRVQPIMTGALFNLDRYLLAHEKIELLFQWLQAADGLALIDAGRGNHFMAVPETYPVEHQFYSRLYAGELHFEQLASYRRYPSLFGFDFDDSAAEISFYGFDHPRVTLFAKGSRNPKLMETKEAWKAAVQSDSSWTDTYLVRGIEELGAGRFAEAERSFKAALRIRPDYTLAHLLLSGSYERLGSAPKARESWNAALATTSFRLLQDRMFVNDLEGMYLAGEKLLAVRALQTGRRCLQFSESHGGPAFLRKIGTLYLRYQMYEDATSIFERLVIEEPAEAAHYATLCRAYLANKKRGRAQMLFGLYAELETDAAKVEELRQLLESADLSSTSAQP